MNKKRLFKFDVWMIVTIVIFLVFLLLFLYPMYKIFINSIYVESEGFTLHAFKEFFSKTYYTSTVFNSLKVTSIVTVLTAILGTSLAYLLHTVRIKGKGVIDIIIIVSVLSPPFIGAYSWILLLGRNGTLTNVINDLFNIQYGGIYGFTGLTVVLTLNLFPLIYLFVSGALKSMDNSLVEAAESMGSVGFNKTRKIIIPLILPTILSASLLVFMRALADFGTPMLIGEGYRTMPVLIYTSFISEMGNDPAFAAAISVIIVVMTTVIFLIQKYVSNRKTIEMSASQQIEPKRVNGFKGMLVYVFIYAIIVIISLPQLVVLYTSFLKTQGRIFTKGFSFDSYISAFTKLGSAITNTYLYSFIAIILIIIIGVLVAYVTVRKKNFFTDTLDTLQMMPYIIPGSVFGIALLYAFSSKPFLLSGSAFIIIIAFVIRRLPFTVRSSAAILRQINPNVEEASQSLGASTIKTFRKITLPIMGPGIISGAIMSWMTIISELSASILLYIGSTRTLTIAIYTEVIRGNFGVAAALSTVLSLTTIIVLLIFFKITGKREIQL